MRKTKRNTAKQSCERDSQEEYKSIIENLTDIYYRADTEGRLVKVSPSALEVFGVSGMEEILGHSLDTVYQNVDERLEFITLLKETGKVKNYRTTLIKKDGSEVYIETTAKILLDGEGNYIGVEGIVRDISDRKKTEDALKESEERYRKLVEQSPFTIAIYQDGKFVYVNPAGISIIGASDEKDLIGKPVLSIIHPDYREDVIKRMELVAKGFSVPSLEEKIIRMDGSYYDVEVVAIATTYNNKPASQVILRDITEQKKAERTIKESEEKFKQLFKNSFDTIVLLDSNGIQRFVSDSCEKAHGYNSTELANIPVIDQMIHPDDKENVILAFQKIISEGSAGVQYRHKHKNGGWVYLEAVGTNQLNNPEINAVVLNVRDITERKKDEQILKENEARLKELNETKDKLFSVIAHDLRSPFNGILGFSELLQNNLRNLSLDDAEKWIDQISFTAKHTLNLLDNLLEWAKTQTGQIEYKPKDHKLRPIIQDIVNVLNSSAKIKNISLTIIQPEDIEVYADFNMLNTILRNLLSNAIKFTNIGGKVEIMVTPFKDQVEIVVKDNGLGMDEETKNNLFAIDKHDTMSGTANEKGSGLGLIICKEFIKRLGGEIEIVSEIGQGSTFTFTLPQSSQIQKN